MYFWRICGRRWDPLPIPPSRLESPEEPFYVSSEGIFLHILPNRTYMPKMGGTPLSSWTKRGPHSAGLGLLSHLTVSASLRGHCFERFCCITHISTYWMNIYFVIWYVQNWTQHPLPSFVHIEYHWKHPLSFCSVFKPCGHFQLLHFISCIS